MSAWSVAAVAQADWPAPHPAVHAEPAVAPAVWAEPAVVPAVHAEPAVAPAVWAEPAVVPAVHAEPAVVPAVHAVAPAVHAEPAVAPAVHAEPAVPQTADLLWALGGWQPPEQNLVQMTEFAAMCETEQSGPCSASSPASVSVPQVWAQLWGQQLQLWAA